MGHFCHFVRQQKSVLLLGIVIFVLPLILGCNMFSPLSSPSGDEQKISAARAKFDDGDFQGAIDLYNQLSSSNQGIALSESAYALLASENATMGNYAAAFGKGNAAIGPAITKFAESMIIGAGQARRVAIYTAFTHYKPLLQIDANLAHLVQFLGALSFAAEILAEEGTAAGPNGLPILTKADLNTLQYNVSGVTTSLSGASSNQIDVATPTYDMMNAALQDIITAVNNLGTNGSFSTNSIQFASSFSSAASQAGNGLATTVFVSALNSANVGE